MVWRISSNTSARLLSKQLLLQRQQQSSVRMATAVVATAGTQANSSSTCFTATTGPSMIAAVLASTACRSFSSSATPAKPQQYSVKDMIVHLTIVDPSGARKQITGLVGKTLYEAFEMQGLDIGPSSGGASPEVARTERWIEPTFGEGPTSGYDHVVLAGKGADSVPRMTSNEQEQLEDFWDFDEIFEGSRLASTITLTKEMNGMVVYVPDRIADDNP